MTFFLMYWKQLAVLAVFALLAAYAGAMRIDRDIVKAEYADYRSQVAKAAQAAAEAALKRTIEDEKNKEKADAEHAKTVARLAADVGRMRRERDAARSRFLSAATSCPDSPAGADGYRAEYERAYRDLVAGLRAEGDRGSKATLALNTAKAWAQSRTRAALPRPPAAPGSKSWLASDPSSQTSVRVGAGLTVSIVW